MHNHQRSSRRSRNVLWASLPAFTLLAASCAGRSSTTPAGDTPDKAELGTVEQAVWGIGLSSPIARPITNGFGVAFPAPACGNPCGKLDVLAGGSLWTSVTVTACDGLFPVVYAQSLPDGPYDYNLTVCGKSYSGSVTVGAKGGSGPFHMVAFGDTQQHTTLESTFDPKCLVSRNGSTYGGDPGDRIAVANAAHAFYATPPRLVIHLGDLGLNSNHRKSDFYDPFATLLSGSMLALVPGNHDWWEQGSGDPGYLGIPQPPHSLGNAPVGDDFNIRPIGPTGYANYSFDYRNIHFLMLDTGYDGKGALSSTSQQFAQNDLSAAHADPSVDFIIVAMHRPVFASFCTTNDDFNDDPEMDKRLSPMFERNGVDIVLAGHNHNYQHRLFNGIHHFISGTGGGAIRDPNGAGSTHPAIATAAELGFLDIAVNGTQITTQFHAIQPVGIPSVFDTTVIQKRVRPPSDLAASADAGMTTLTWTDNASSESGYRVEYSDAGDAGPWTTLAPLAQNVTTYTYAAPHTARSYRVIATGVSADTDSPPSNTISFRQPDCAIQTAAAVEDAWGGVVISYTYPAGACGAGALRTELFRGNGVGRVNNWVKVNEGAIGNGALSMTDTASCRNGERNPYVYKLVGVLSDRTTEAKTVAISPPGIIARCAASQFQLLDFDTNTSFPNMARLDWTWDGGAADPPSIAEYVWMKPQAGPWQKTAYKKGDYVPIECGEPATQFKVEVDTPPINGVMQFSMSSIASMHRPCVDDVTQVVLETGTNNLRVDWLFAYSNLGHDGVIIDRRYYKPNNGWTEYAWLKTIKNPSAGGHYIDPIPGNDVYEYRVSGYKDILDPYTGRTKRWRSNLGSVDTGATVGGDTACNTANVSIMPENLGGGIWGCPGKIGFTDRASLCAPGCKVVTAEQWSNRDPCHAGAAPTHAYWTDDALKYNGTSNNCWVSLYTGVACAANQPMRICPATSPDPEGNACNWTMCSYQMDSNPSDYFGGCTNSATAGTLCVCPADVPDPGVLYCAPQLILTP